MSNLKRIISEEINKMTLLKEYVNPKDSDIIMSYAIGLEEMYNRIIKANPELKHEYTTMTILNEAGKLKKLSSLVMGNEPKIEDDKKPPIKFKNRVKNPGF